MIPNCNEIRDLCCVFNCAWTPDRMRGAYDAIVIAWKGVGHPPDRLASQAPDVPGIGDKWGSFKYKHRRLEQTGFEGVISVSLSRLAEPNDSYPTVGALYPDRDWIMYATASRRYQKCVLGWIPAIIGGPAHALFETCREVASLSGARYGYRYQRRYNLRPIWEQPPETPVERDLCMNASWWEPEKPEQSGALLLRDVYLRNYLSNSHLAAPIGKAAMTLRDWIERKPAERGELRQFTDVLVEWTPPVKNIPHIREALFRGGRLFYWRFFNPSNRRKDAPPILQSGLMDESWQEPERYYRPNIIEPWEATDPIPEIFQANRYHELFQDRQPE